MSKCRLTIRVGHTPLLNANCPMPKRKQNDISMRFDILALREIFVLPAEVVSVRFGDVSSRVRRLADWRDLQKLML